MIHLYIKYKLKLYGKGFNKNKLKVEEGKSVLFYQGAFPSDEIAYNIEANFGLVWDGISTETCSGQYGAYLKYNKKLRLNIIDIDNNNFLYNVLVIFSISIATL